MDEVSDDVCQFRLSQNPADEVFLQYAQSLRKVGKMQEAMNVLLAALSLEQEHYRGRLLLAQVFYQLGYTPFAIRELEQILKTFPENQSIISLYEKLSGQGVSSSSTAIDTVAEGEFSVDDL